MTNSPARRAAATAALLSCLAAGAATAQSGVVLVKAARIIVAPDTVLENEALLIRDGKVALVGREIPAEARRGARVVTFEKGTVVPGFVNPHTNLGHADDLAERISAFTPELKAADGFDPFDEELLRHARYGITTVGLAPASANTFAGLAAVVKTGEIGEVVADAAYLKLCLVPESMDQNRFPTSRMGAAQLVRQSFSAARLAAETDPRSQTLRGVLGGTTPLAIHARSRAAILAALDLCEELSAPPMLIGADEVEGCLDRLAKLGGSVMLEPLRVDDKLERLRLPATLEKAGVPFSFTAERSTAGGSRQQAPSFPGLPPGFVMPGQSPRRRGAKPEKTFHPEALRLSAALAVRHGTSRRAALAALTRTPARQCGAQARCGTLREGRDADFVVFGGDPLDLTSPVLAVYRAGQRIDPGHEEPTR